ncbi:unnamed protein product, partial [Darwinula stevensoni]
GGRGVLRLHRFQRPRATAVHRPPSNSGSVERPVKGSGFRLTPRKSPADRDFHSHQDGVVGLRGLIDVVRGVRWNRSTSECKPPGRPTGLRAMDARSRSVVITWDEYPPSSGVQTFVLNHKKTTDGWDEGKFVTTEVSSNELDYALSSLQPATSYTVRAFARNHLGLSLASEELVFLTEEEGPTGEVRDLKAEVLGPRSALITWSPPDPQTWNSIRLNYRLGIKSHHGDQYNSTEVQPKDEGKPQETLRGLRPFTKYFVTVRAFNGRGVGPLPLPLHFTTLEDVPGEPPQALTCKTLTSTGIEVQWDPPPTSSQNGILQGYKILYYHDEDRAKEMTSSRTTVILKDLLKFTNYSIQVLAFTSAGDGVSSPPVSCVTHQDLPGPVGGIKCLRSKKTAVMVSWIPPQFPNGPIRSYEVQIRRVPSGEEEFRKSASPHLTAFEVQGMKAGEYDVWVWAANAVGGGERSPPVRVVVDGTVPAGIYSFGGVERVWRGADHTLWCHSVGDPAPRTGWVRGDGEGVDHLVERDGSLRIRGVGRGDGGGYTCTVYNPLGRDSISYRLHVLVPPSPPQLRILDRTQSTIEAEWESTDDGGSPITHYVVEHKADGEWVERKTSQRQTSLRVEDLPCGTALLFRVRAGNRIGESEPSRPVSTRTLGDRPVWPRPDDPPLVANHTSVQVFLDRVRERECPLEYVSLEYMRENEDAWIIV